MLRFLYYGECSCFINSCGMYIYDIKRMWLMYFVGVELAMISILSNLSDKWTFLLKANGIGIIVYVWQMLFILQKKNENNSNMSFFNRKMLLFVSLANAF